MPSKDESAGSFLTLLDKAYDAPSRPERYADFMEAARALLFAADGATPSPPHVLALDEKLAPHLDRIEALFAATPAPSDHDGAAVAHFTAGPGGRIVSGNSAAEAFFGATFPCGLDALGLTHDSERKLAAACAAAEDSLVLLMSERHGGAAAGLCARKGAQTDVSLSYIEWTAETVSFIARALDLTETETGVLSGHLRGLSQNDIAAERGRSAETVKAQTKAILRKSGCAKISELSRLAANIALLRIAQGEKPPLRPYAFDPATNAPQSLALSCGRTLSYYVYGAKGDFPLLFVHGSLVGPFMTRRMGEGLAALGVTMYAPSRPGFGETTAAARGEYDAATVADALALADHIGAKELIVATIHGGVSHAYRCAAALGERVKGMVMIGAGAPIDDRKHLRHMNNYTRIAAAAAKYAPAVFEMITSIGIAAYSRRGARDFIDEYFADSAVDRDTLRDQEIYTLVEKGVAHLVDQGARTFVDDGASQMADWSSDFDSVHARALWVHAEDDPVLKAHFVEEFVKARSNHPVETVAEGGYLLLYRRPEIALDAISRALKW
ncbi:MAG: alpha/beta hydrolase [Parvularculaceae bacterium]